MSQTSFYFKKYPDVWFGWGAVIFALAIRLAAWYQSPLISRDGVHYLDRGGIVSDTVQALAPYLTILCRLANAWGVAPEWLIVTVNLLAGSLLAGVVYLIGRKCQLERWTAAVAAALVAINPFAVDVSHQVQRESLFMLWCGVMLLCLLVARQGKHRNIWLWLTGAAGALAFLGRLEALEWLLLLGLVLVFEACRQRDYRRGIIDLIAVGAGFGIVLFAMLWLMNLPLYELVDFFSGKIGFYFLRGSR